MLKDERTEKYISFRETDFAADAYFLQWRWLRSKECTEFWTAFRAQHPEKEPEIRRAISIVDSIRLNEKRFSEGEKRQAVGKLMHYIRARKRNRWMRIYTSVAAAVVLVALFVVAAPYLFTSGTEEPTRAYIVPNNQEIRLIAEDNRVVPIADQSQIVCEPDGRIAVNGEQESTVSHQTNEEEAYRKLVVPDGKRTSLLLADGTRVWVNSGTTLEFPVAFVGKERRIKVDGEIYLEVVKNPEMPFIVSSSQFEVEVLGTKFGVSAYAQMKEQHVVLVEGAVQVNTPSGSTRLQPSQLLSIEEETANIATVDPYGYISWKDGVLYFNGETLQEVFFRLSRQYAVDIISQGEVGSIRLYGKLVLAEHVEEALDNISVLSPIAYRVQDNKIIVNKK